MVEFVRDDPAEWTTLRTVLFPGPGPMAEAMEAAVNLAQATRMMDVPSAGTISQVADSLACRRRARGRAAALGAAAMAARATAALAVPRRTRLRRRRPAHTAASRSVARPSGAAVVSTGRTAQRRWWLRRPRRSPPEVLAAPPTTRATGPTLVVRATTPYGKLTARATTRPARARTAAHTEAPTLWTMKGTLGCACGTVPTGTPAAPSLATQLGGKGGLGMLAAPCGALDGRRGECSARRGSVTRCTP